MKKQKKRHSGNDGQQQAFLQRKGRGKAVQEEAPFLSRKRLEPDVQAKLQVNDDPRLEEEAERMSEYVMRDRAPGEEPPKISRMSSGIGRAQQKCKDCGEKKAKTNVIIVKEQPEEEEQKKNEPPASEEIAQRLPGDTEPEKPLQMQSQSLPGDQKYPQRKVQTPDEIQTAPKRPVQRATVHGPEDVPLQRKSETDGTPSVSDDFNQRLQHRRGGGKPLADDVQLEMSDAFGGVDFSEVGVHDDDEAVQMSQSINARAFTSGPDVYFNRGEYDPHSREKRKTLGHELTHVVQQGVGVNKGSIARLNDPETLQLKAYNNDYYTASYLELGKPWRVSIRITEMPEAQSEAFVEYVDACEDGVSEAINSLSPGLESELYSRRIKLNLKYQPGTPYYLVKEKAKKLARIFVLGKAKVEEQDQPKEDAFTRRQRIRENTDAVIRRLREVEATYKEHFEGFRTALDELDVAGIAVVPQLLEVDWGILNEIWEELTKTKSDQFLVSEAMGVVLEMQKSFSDKLGIYVGLQHHKGGAILGSYEFLSKGKDPIAYLHSEVPVIIRVVESLNQILDIATSQESLPVAEAMNALYLFRMDRGRPVNIFFKEYVLKYYGVFNKIEKALPPFLDFSLTTSQALKAGTDFGHFTNVGDFELDKAIDLLSRNVGDWRISDEEAMAVYDMLVSAPPEGCEAILRRLDEKDKLDTLLSNIGWAYVKGLHNYIQDFFLKRKLHHYFAGKGGGESLSSIYERKIMTAIKEDRMAAGYLWTFLSILHNSATYNFLDTYSEAYDLHQKGLISSDSFYYTASVALGRAVAVLAATVVTGGAAGSFFQGAGRTALALSPRGAAIFGNVIGGATSGVAGTFTADVINQAFLGQEGFSPGSSYLEAAFAGGGFGLLASSGQILPKAPKGLTLEEFASVRPWRARLAKWGGKMRVPEKAPAKLYAKKHSWLAKLIRASHRGSLKIGRKLKGQPTKTRLDFHQEQAAKEFLQEAEKLELEALRKEAKARGLRKVKPKRAARIRTQAKKLRHEAGKLKQKARKFERGQAHPLDDLPEGTELDRAVDEAIAKARSEEPGLVEVPLSAIEKNPSALLRTFRPLMVSRSGNRVVFRVEGGGSRSLIHLDSQGNIKIQQGKTVHLNFGSPERAIEFLMKRGAGSKIYVFEVNESFVKALRSSAIPEYGTKAMKGKAPRLVDVRFANDQMEIPKKYVEALQRNIIPGSGRIFGIKSD